MLPEIDPQHGQIHLIARLEFRVSGFSPRIKLNLPGPVRVEGKQESLRDLGGGVWELDLRQDEEALLCCGDRVPVPTVEPLPAQEGKCNRYGLTIR